MERKKLASDVTEFAVEYGIFNISCDKKEIKQRIEEQFCDPAFVEELINMVILKSKEHLDIDTGKLIELLTELEIVRLELEYKAPEGSNPKC